MTMREGGIIMYRTKATVGITQDYHDRWDYIVQDQKERWDYKGSCGQAGLVRRKKRDGIRQIYRTEIIRQEQEDRQDHDKIKHAGQDLVDRWGWM
jgi:nitrate reductase alpha subunit